MSKNVRRALGWGALVITALVLVLLALREAPIGIEVGAVERGPLTVTLDEEGVTRVRDRYVVLAPLDGHLQRVTLDPGDAVRGGETVVTAIVPLAPNLLDARSIGMAEARVDAARATIERARAQQATAEALLTSAQEDLARYERAGSAVSDQVLSAARREARYTEGEASAARAAVAVAEEELRVAESALAFARPSALVEEGSVEPPPAFPVHAPTDGIVLAVERRDAGPVRIGERLVVVGDKSRLEVAADYLTTDAVRIEPGDAAILEGWGGDAPLDARVRRVEPAARTKVSSLGVEQQRVDVVLDLVDRPEVAAALADGFRVTVRVVVWHADDVLRVPEAALVRRGGGWAVFVHDGRNVELRDVEIGHRDGRAAEVLGGVDEGTRVVLYPSEKLTSGARAEERSAG